MKHNNWFWGVFFVLAAVFVVASQILSFTQIGFLSILATVLLAAVFIQSLVKLNYFGAFLSLALAYLIYQQPLGLYFISPWLLILAAVLVSIGFHIIFRKHSKPPCCTSYAHHGEAHYETVEDIDDNNPSVRVSFGASSKYLHANALKTGQFSVSFGALDVYFDQVQLDLEGAQLFLDCSFGAIKLYFPKTWHIVDSLSASLGGVSNDTRFSKPGPGAPTVTLTGNVSLGGVEIYYV
ncbi:hypothetical protein IZU99_07175 [Oscillospiraceae bacterium CM]|nr:hypothetical protein IZU99_07175 [Oscillospiraceae bacterium CM]